MKELMQSRKYFGGNGCFFQTNISSSSAEGNAITWLWALFLPDTWEEQDIPKGNLVMELKETPRFRC